MFLKCVCFFFVENSIGARKRVISLSNEENCRDCCCREPSLPEGFAECKIKHNAQQQFMPPPFKSNNSFGYSLPKIKIYIIIVLYTCIPHGYLSHHILKMLAKLEDTVKRYFLSFLKGANCVWILSSPGSENRLPGEM